MARLGPNQWGKSEVRLSKVRRGDQRDGFSDLVVQVLLTGDVEPAYLDGDNSAVLPTDTTKNTIYGLAQEHLDDDLEAFGVVLCRHLTATEGVESATATIRQKMWTRHTDTGFIGGGPERRMARVEHGPGGDSVGAGVEGLVVLKTRGSAFKGFPRDEFTILPEAEDRLLATSVTANWDYSEVPGNTTETWEEIRGIILDRFFEDWSASVQHQGWMIAEAILDSVPEITEITFQLPNQHHLPFDLSRFGKDHENTTFHPVSEPYGDIRFTATR